MKKLFAVTVLFAIILSCTGKKIERVIETYDNGDPKLIYFYDKDNKKVGEKSYYPGKKLRFEGVCENDRYTGVWKYYYPDSKLFAQGDFSHGMQGDNWIFNDVNGQSYIEAGFKVNVVSFNEKEFSPSEIKIYQDETVKTINIKFFERNFNPYMLVRQEGGVRNGISISWFNNGFKNSECSYKDGFKNGEYKVWHENGNLYYEGLYVMDKETGIWKYYNEDGSLAFEKNYDQSEK